ncbi:hypothetical protein DMH03_33545 [Amycolatopsis sp. WAC 01376]|uniref:hypothetical protein n=1 Tax=Amycolatopsis sp. WAC 01376 TaxID=2203195 RepID=UPI000F77EEED|nr:hypothetical protein [Amycolatopsis sp. WAC 01376]RSM55112.1 hypothetical protein DMH03_33545 [Amycolatopsis sp. WAC 01376]
MAEDERDDDARSMTPEESLALIAAQSEKTRREIGPNPAVLLAVWGLVWLFGFGLVYVSAPPTALLPMWAAAAIVGAGFVGAMAYSAVYGIRSGRGVRGPSRLVGAMYGWSWMIAFGGLTVVNTALIRLGLDTELIPLLWSGTALMLTGLMYLAGGMLWQSRLQYGLGVWIIACGAASVLAGGPYNFLVLSVAGGGGFLVASLVFLVRAR